MPSLTVVMPALNEERALEQAVENAIHLLEPFFQRWEILIFNDGSTDRTGEIAEMLANRYTGVHVTHHESPKNLGGVYREGVAQAQMEYLMLLPGDDENGSESLWELFRCIGKADILVPYVKNPGVRPWARRVLSRTFVAAINALSGCRLKYYNGTVVHRTELLKKCSFRTSGFGYQAEILVRLIRKGASFREVGVELAKRDENGSAALRPKNLWQIFKFLSRLSFQSRFSVR